MNYRFMKPQDHNSLPYLISTARRNSSSVQPLLKVNYAIPIHIKSQLFPQFPFHYPVKKKTPTVHLKGYSAKLKPIVNDFHTSRETKDELFCANTVGNTGLKPIMIDSRRYSQSLKCSNMLISIEHCRQPICTQKSVGVG